MSWRSLLPPTSLLFLNSSWESANQYPPPTSSLSVGQLIVNVVVDFADAAKVFSSQTVLYNCLTHIVWIYANVPASGGNIAARLVAGFISQIHRFALLFGIAPRKGAGGVPPSTCELSMKPTPVLRSPPGQPGKVSLLS